MEGQSGVTIYHGDCREIDLALNSIDSIVTDPPYGLEFMNNRVAFRELLAEMHEDGPEGA